MFLENEIVMLLLGTGVTVFLLLNVSKIKEIDNYKYLLTSYFILLLAWVSTVVEGLFFQSALNVLEHICYALSMLVLLWWCCVAALRKT